MVIYPALFGIFCNSVCDYIVCAYDDVTQCLCTGDTLPVMANAALQATCRSSGPLK